MTDKAQHTLRLGERVVRRVGGGPTGDIVGFLNNAVEDGFLVSRDDDRKIVWVGWEDASLSWEAPNELRRADET